MNAKRKAACRRDLRSPKLDGSVRGTTGSTAARSEQNRYAHTTSAHTSIARIKQQASYEESRGEVSHLSHTLFDPSQGACICRPVCTSSGEMSQSSINFLCSTAARLPVDVDSAGGHDQASIDGMQLNAQISRGSVRAVQRPLYPLLML
jgi:hypothetical protein